VRAIGPARRLASGLTAIAAAFVGHDPLDDDAVSSEPGEGAFEEADGACLAFVRQDFGVGQPGGIIVAKE
jgi:hypothetical protein